MADRSGRLPVSWASGRSSTTARMAMPVRVPKSRDRRKRATKMAATMVKASCHWRLTTPRSKALPS